MDIPAGWARIVKTGTPQFQQLHRRIGDLILERWPNAIATIQGTMAAYAVPVITPPRPEEWRGTMPRDQFIIAPTEKKAGITIHFWHPNYPYLLKENAFWLKEAGFNPMVGCVQWNRQAPLDVNAVKTLLNSVS